MGNEMEKLEKTLEGISIGTEKMVTEVSSLSESVEEVGKRVASIEEINKEAEVNSAASAKLIEDIADKYDGQEKRITGIRKLLEHNHGKSGSEDWLNIFGKFILGVYHQKRHGRVPDQFLLDGYDFTQKANATTQVDTNAGFLVPDILFPELLAAEDIYGNLLPLVRSINMSPGSTLKINQQATKAAASWRCAECTAVPESEILLEQLTLEPCLLGDIIPVSQELFNYPGANFAEIVADNTMRSIVEKKEFGILQGDSAVGGAAAPPADGVLVDTGVFDILAGLPADTTLEDYLTFIGAAVDNYNALFVSGVLFLPLSRYFALMSNMVSKLAVSPGWDSMKPGAPGSPLGYPAVPHAGMQMTEDWAAFLNPQDIVTATTGGMSIDINPYASPGWSSHCISIKMYTYFDWVLSNVGGMSKGDYATV